MSGKQIEAADEWLGSRPHLVAASIAICGLIWRLWYATHTYLNPDEALHYTVAAHPWYGLAGFYRNAAITTHPPLFIVALEAVLQLGRSEWLLRLVPAVAGVMFPWSVGLWVRRLSGLAGALAAQMVLTFSPSLIDLSTEVRGYTLAFLFLSVALVLLEEALDTARTSYMVWFHVFLYLAILTEYCVIWIVASMGVYALCRLWRHQAARGLRVVWLLGQTGAFLLCLFLFYTQIARLSRGDLQAAYSTWLRDMFPQSNDSPALFALRGTLRQFLYLFQHRWPARVAAIVFSFGLYKLWKGKSAVHVLLLALPFGLAAGAAIVHMFPYGPSRHTSVLCILIVAGLGCAIQSVAKNRMLPVLTAALPLVIIWNLFSIDLGFAIPRDRRQLSSMREAVMFLENTVPPGSVIVTDQGTDVMLGYYLGCPSFEFYDSNDFYYSRRCRGLQFIAAPDFQFSGTGPLRAAFIQARARFHSDKPVWAAAGGWHIDVANPVSDARPFGKAIAIFQESDLPPISNQP